MCTFWINHYLKIMFLKCHALEPPPLKYRMCAIIRQISVVWRIMYKISAKLLKSPP